METKLTLEQKITLWLGGIAILVLACAVVSFVYAQAQGAPPVQQVNADWNASTGASQIMNKPNMAPIALTGNYSDLNGVPLWPQAFENTTQRLNAFPVYKTATVTSNFAVFNLTADGTQTGAALCPNGLIQASIQPIVNNSTTGWQYSWTLSNANKTVTVRVNQAAVVNISVLTININVLGAPTAAPDGTSVSLYAVCY